MTVPDQMPLSAVSDLGLHCSLRSVRILMLNTEYILTHICQRPIKETLTQRRPRSDVTV